MKQPLNIAIRMVRGNRKQEDFADLLGVTVRTISRWENDDDPELTLSNLRLLVGHGLPQEYLLAAQETGEESTAGEAA